MKALSVTGFSLLAATVLWSACGEDGTPQSPRDLDEDTSEASAGDAGRNSRRDSGSSTSDDDDDSADDDSADDDSADDDSADDDSADDDSDDDSATPPRNDAGAGDAGRADAGRADAGGGSGNCASLTYAAFGKQVIEDHCSTCHSGEEPVGTIALESLADIKEHKDAIQEQVVDMMAMPPRNARPMLSAANRMKIAQWLECGPN